MRRILVIALVLAAGCQSIGPPTVSRDQFGYNQAIAVSQKEQLLLNMVRLRYGDAPVFLQVASVITQYSVEAQVAATAPGYDRPNNVGPPIATAGGRYTNRPTITYQPLTGTKLASILLAPIPIEAAFALIQSGWSIVETLRSTVRTLNGIPAVAISGNERFNPRFMRAVEAIARVRDTGAGGTQIHEDRIVWALYPDPSRAEQVEAARDFRAALNLDPEVDEYRLVISAYPGNGREITLTMSSVLGILDGMAAFFHVPDAHIARGWAYPASNPEPDAEGRIVVHSSIEQPENAFVATRERGYWFWVDESDLRSKRVFSFLSMLLALAESGGNEAPLVTIGAGGT